MKYVLAVLDNASVERANLLFPVDNPLRAFYRAFGQLAPHDEVRKRRWRVEGGGRSLRTHEIADWVEAAVLELRRRGGRERHTARRKARERRGDELGHGYGYGPGIGYGGITAADIDIGHGRRGGDAGLLPKAEVQVSLVCHDSFGEEFIALARHLETVAGIRTHFLGFCATMETHFDVDNRCFHAVERAYHAHRRIRRGWHEAGAPSEAFRGGSLGREVRAARGFPGVTLLSTLGALGFSSMLHEMSTRWPSARAPARSPRNAGGRFVDAGVFYDRSEQQAVYHDLRHEARQAGLPFEELGGGMSPEEWAWVKARGPKPRKKPPAVAADEDEAVTAVKPKLLVRLHFLRYGKFHEEVEDDNTVTLREKDTYTLDDVKAKRSGVPKLDHFYTARTGLRPGGYVYVFNAATPAGGDCHEFEVRPDGSLSAVTWTPGADGAYPDVRKATGGAAAYLEVEEGQSYYVAYATHQWSGAYLHAVRTDAAKLTARMRLVEATGVPMDGAPPDPHVVACGDVYAVCHQGDAAIAGLQARLRASEAKGTEEEAAGLTSYGDMYVALDDAIGCADDVADVLALEFAAHRANTVAMRYGCDPEPIYEALVRDPTYVKTAADDEERARSDLFTTALTIYQCVYNDPRGSVKFDGGAIGNDAQWRGDPTRRGGRYPHYEGLGLHKQKLLDVLGVEERRVLRAYLRELQADLAKLVQSGYYYAPLADEAEGSDLCCLLGKAVAQEHLSHLVADPHDVDRGLDLKVDREREASRPWDGYLTACATVSAPRNRVEEVLYRAIEIDEAMAREAEERGISLATKAALFFEKAGESATKAMSRMSNVAELVERRNYLVELYARVGVHGYSVMGVTDFEATATRLASGDYRVSAPAKVSVAEVAGVKTTTVEELARVEDVTERLGGVRDVAAMPKRVGEFTLRTTVTVEAPASVAGAAKAFLGSPVFRGVVAILQFQNARIAVAKAFDEQSPKNAINAIGITAELVEAGLQLADVLKQRVVGEALSEKPTAYMRRAGIVGAGVTAGVCAADAVERCYAEDYDAMLAYAGAGAAFATLAAATFYGTAWAGPPGWMCALAGCGLIYLAYVWTDDPILTFFKQIIFSDRVGFHVKGAQPTWEFNKAIYKDRRDYLPDGEAREGFVDTGKVLAKLYDLLVACEVHLSPVALTRTASQNMKSGYGNLATGTTYSTGYATAFDVTASFKQFLASPEQVEAEAYYYPRGIEAGGARALTTLGEVRVYPGVEGMVPRFEQRLTLPADLVAEAGSESCLLYLCRLRVDAQTHYPLSYCGDERWVGAVVKVRQVKDNTGVRDGVLPAKAAATWALLDGSAWTGDD